jgi:hypothetical protein
MILEISGDDAAQLLILNRRMWKAVSKASSFEMFQFHHNWIPTSHAWDVADHLWTIHREIINNWPKQVRSLYSINWEPNSVKQPMR